jgi:hypothetical protein
MRDLSKLFWADLETDEEREAFVRSGRAVETRIITPAVAADVANAYRAKRALYDAVDLAGSGCMPLGVLVDDWKDILNA